MIHQTLAIDAGRADIGAGCLVEAISGLLLGVIVPVIIQCGEALPARSLLPAAAMALPLLGFRGSVRV